MPLGPDLLAPGFTASPYWWDAAEPAPEPEAPVPDDVDVAIIGGGYAGLSAALTLRRLGHQASVFDAERIGWGASSRNGGMVSGGLKLASGDLERRFGAERGGEIARAAAASFPFIEELIARENIACDYVRSGRFLAAWTPGHYRDLAERVEYVADVTGLPARMVPAAAQASELGSSLYHGGMMAEATGSLHPGKYLRGLRDAALRAGAILVDRARVEVIARTGSGFVLRTTRGRVRAAAVLMATNGYALGPDGSSPMPWLARRLIPVGSYIIATEKQDPGLIRALFPTLRMVSDTRRVLSYFRPSPDGTRVLWGGRASFRGTTPEAAAPVLHAMMRRVFPALRSVRISHVWTGNVAFTFDFLPHIGVQDGIHYAAGCQGSGIAMATWLGHQAGLKIAGAANAPFALDGLAFPTMPLYRGAPWFLPLVGGWYRLRDRIDRAVA